MWVASAHNEDSIRDSWKTLATYVFLFCLRKPLPTLELLSKPINYLHTHHYICPVSRVLKSSISSPQLPSHFTPSHTMSSNDSPSTLQSAIDSVKGAAQSVLDTVTGKE